MRGIKVVDVIHKAHPALFAEGLDEFITRIHDSSCKVETSLSQLEGSCCAHVFDPSNPIGLMEREA